MASGTLHLVDPELRPALDLLPSIELSPASLAATRVALAAMAAAAPARDDLPVRREELTVPGPAGAPGVRVLLYTPAGEAGARPALLHIHGGGYVLGAPEMDDTSSRLLATDLGCIVCAVDYRLAPEHPHPAPVEDCFAALCWLHSQAATFGIDPARIGIHGESAGGGLAAALALLARDRGGPAIAFQQLIYPMLDDRTCIDPDPNPCAGEFVWTPANNRFGWASLLGKSPGGPDVSPYAAAARATNLCALPPAFVSVGALDLFVEENMDYARRLTRAGVPVELHVYAGAYHGYRFAAEARTSLASQRDSREALRRAMHG